MSYGYTEPIEAYAALFEVFGIALAVIFSIWALRAIMNTRNRECKACQGRGWVAARLYPNSLHSCVECRGTGSVRR
jgi:hypothetical protein